MNAKYIGYSADDKALLYAKYLDETPCTTSDLVAKALENQPLPAGVLLSFEQISVLQKKGYAEIENGYSIERDGSARVAVHTLMPNVSPAMWHWWFGWHGCADSRYKLWHPQAHLAAEWLDGENSETYIGRTSVIQEYIGRKLEKANIRFVAPEDLGLKNSVDMVYICARLGYTAYPLDFGWLVHQVRAIEGGAEMRSRFWIGGKYIAIRKKGSFFNFLSTVLQKLYRLPEAQPKYLLQHCSEEMRHLAKFLPDLYLDFKL
jgi:hypothetical protein